MLEGRLREDGTDALSEGLMTILHACYDMRSLQTVPAIRKSVEDGSAWDP